MSSLKPVVPSDVWSASDLDENMSPIIGTTIDFVCPEGLKLSHDNDGFYVQQEKLMIFPKKLLIGHLVSKVVPNVCLIYPHWMKLVWSELMLRIPFLQDKVESTSARTLIWELTG